MNLQEAVHFDNFDNLLVFLRRPVRENMRCSSHGDYQGRRLAMRLI